MKYIPSDVRLIVFSYLGNTELVGKVSILSKASRQALSNRKTIYEGR